MLLLQIGFPAGRYSAASIDDPTTPEWPPHPSRVFSALVAAAHIGGRLPTLRERELLERLERAGAPLMAFPDADTSSGGTSYVPVNDEKTRLSNKSSGVLQPNRQPRYFAVAYPLGEPEVLLWWNLELQPDEIDTLDAIAQRMSYLGSSHSLVTARFMPAQLMGRTYAPRAHGELALRVATPGRLDELDELFEQRGGVVRRPLPRCEEIVPYALTKSANEQPHHSTYELVVFRMKGASWGADTAHTLGKSVRRAVMSRLDALAPAAVHGHDLAQLHVAWLPLPDVGHQHAGGKVRGIGVAVPNSLSGEERGLTLATVARLASVRLPDGQLAELEPVTVGADTPRVLKVETWSGWSTSWSTVTPVILDRPPKKLEPEQIALALVDSLQRAGYPTPVSVTVSSYSDFTGAPSIHDVPSRIPRTHARVVFAEHVQGPVIAGRLKYFGTGLFRPTPAEYRS